MAEQRDDLLTLPFVLTVTGQGGHSAKPHQTADPIVAAAMVIQNLRCGLAGQGVQLWFQTICAGTRHNIIPTQAVCRGKLVTRTWEEQSTWKTWCEQIAADIAKAHRTSAVFAFETASEDA